MIEINTIQDFFALTREQRGDICRNLNTVGRLKEYLNTLNNPRTVSNDWKPCSKCGMKGWVMEQHEERNNADIHASQIHKCIKHAWYSCNEYVLQRKSKVEPEGRLVFDHGHMLHHMLQSYGKKGAWGDPKYYQDEVVIVPNAQEAKDRKAHILEEAIKYRIRSSVDAIIWKYVVNNVRDLGDVSIRVIHEYKSIGPGKPTKDGTLYGGFAALKGPLPYHKQQGIIYQHCFNIPIIVFLYYNKGNDMIADFPVPYDYLTWNMVKGKIDRILNYVDKQEMPPWEETSAILDSSECKTCDYLTVCNPPKSVTINQA